MSGGPATLSSQVVLFYSYILFVLNSLRLCCSKDIAFFFVGPLLNDLVGPLHELSEYQEKGYVALF